MSGSFRDRIGRRQAPDPGPLPLIGRWTLHPGEGGPAFLGPMAIRPGDFLVPDARGEWALAEPGREPRPGAFAPGQMMGKHEATSVRAIGQELVGVMGKGWVDWVGVQPLVPRISERVELQRLERRLRECLGHLEAVFRRPRAHLRVEIERVPVSRARRIPNQAAAYLASHTEDWERPTLRGVLPKRILSLVQNDELDIYENRFAARLLDHLLRYLGDRIAEVTDLLRVLDQARQHDAEAASGSHWRRHRLYRLWGDAMDAGEGHRKAEETLKELSWLRRTLAGLMDSTLYRAIPRRASVGNGVRTTNILANDPHYHRLAELWREMVPALGLDQVRTPKDVFRDHQALCRGFVGFGVLLVVRALEQMDINPEDLDAPFARGARLSLQGQNGALALRWDEDDAVVVAGEDGTSLRFVPVPAALGGLEEGELWRCVDEIAQASPPEEGLVVLYPAPTPAQIASMDPGRLRLLSALRSDLRARERTPPGGVSLIPVSPWDLGSVERVARALRWVATAPALREYPRRLRAPGSEVISLQGASAWLVTSGPGALAVLRPPLEHEEIGRAIEEAVARWSARADALEREHEEASQAARLAAKGSGRTRDLNARKQALNAERSSAKRAHAEALAFQAELEEAVKRSRAWLRCPTCGKDADPRHDFQAAAGHGFRCACPHCSSRWGTRACESCGGTVPFLLLPVAFDGTGEGWGWLDRLLGRDVLAVPCRQAAASSGPALICPSCGACPCPNCRAEEAGGGATDPPAHPERGHAIRSAAK